MKLALDNGTNASQRNSSAIEQAIQDMMGYAMVMRQRLAGSDQAETGRAISQHAQQLVQEVALIRDRAPAGTAIDPYSVKMVS